MWASGAWAHTVPKALYSSDSRDSPSSRHCSPHRTGEGGNRDTEIVSNLRRVSCLVNSRVWIPSMLPRAGGLTSHRWVPVPPGRPDTWYAALHFLSLSGYHYFITFQRLFEKACLSRIFFCSTIPRGVYVRVFPSMSTLLIYNFDITSSLFKSCKNRTLNSQKLSCLY